MNMKPDSFLSRQSGRTDRTRRNCLGEVIQTSVTLRWGEQAFSQRGALDDALAVFKARSFGNKELSALSRSCATVRPSQMLVTHIVMQAESLVQHRQLESRF